MTKLLSKTTQPRCEFSTDQERWQAVVHRDPNADGLFFYSVKTTGVYCRTVCPARLALRKNVLFHPTCRAAEAAGFRPCKRCKPTESSLVNRQATAIVQACRLIETADQPLPLNQLANSVGMSRYHFHRVFKAQTGITPKAYARAHRSRRVRNELSQAATVTEAIYGAGFHSNSRFYESSSEVLGMTPTRFRTGGKGTTIRFAIGKCWLGSILVAASEIGICAILLGDDGEELTRDLHRRFPKANLLGGDKSFQQLVAKVVNFVTDPAVGLNLPLDIRGTAFQQRVWEALRKVPLGSTTSYAEIAKRIGQPKSVRAVAGAIAANSLAVVIPCHRVIRTDGSLSGYRWGVDRKSKLLHCEQGEG